MERTRGLALPTPLTLEQCVTLLMSPPGVIQDPIFYKTDTHLIDTSSNSDSGNLHATLHDHLNLSATLTTNVKPFAGTVMPDKSGKDLFLRATCVLDKGESTLRFDCNTLGPVPVASGYGSRTLTQSAAHVLNESKENASSLRGEAISAELDGTPVVESTDIDYKMTCFTV